MKLKAVVVELKDGKAAVLDMDGIVRVVENANYQIGQILSVPALAPVDDPEPGSRVIPFSVRMRRKILPAASSIAILLVGGAALGATYLPVTTVTLDLNPSIGYSLNFFDKVLSMEAYNTDGQEIVDAVSSTAKGKTVEDAIEITLDAIDEAGYISESDTAMVITVDSPLSKSGMEKEVVSTVDRWNSKKVDAGEPGSVAVSAVSVTDDLRNAAREQNVSPGRVYMEEKNLLPGSPAASDKGSASGSGSFSLGDEGSADRDSQEKGQVQSAETPVREGSGSKEGAGRQEVQALTGDEEPSSRQDQEQGAAGQDQEDGTQPQDQEKAQTETLSQPQSQMKSQTQTEAQTQTETQPQTQAEAQTQTQPETPNQNQNQPETPNQNQTQAQPQSGQAPAESVSSENGPVGQSAQSESQSQSSAPAGGDFGAFSSDPGSAPQGGGPGGF